jgi:hypothetical protein
MTAVWNNGFYREELLVNFEVNTDFLLRYKKDFASEKLDFTAAFAETI